MSRPQSAKAPSTETLLFEFEVASEPQPTAEQWLGDFTSTWTPPAPDPASTPVPLPLQLVEPEAIEAEAEVEIEIVPEPRQIVVETVTDVVEIAVMADDGPLPEWAQALGVFDLETTGVDTATARIVTAHVGVIDETGAVVERKEWIVDPGVPIPDGAAAIHGITDERAQRFGRAPAEVVAEILAAIRSIFGRGFPLVVYNAPYDLTLLAAEADRHRLWPLETTAPIVDPLVLDKQLDRFRRGKRTLTRAAEVYGVVLDDAHDAGADAIAAGRVAQAIARRHAAELTIPAQQLHDAQIGWCAEQSDRSQTYMRESKDPEFSASGGWPAR